ncbi:MAG: hypothetical protein ACR2ML_03720 [Solirubrobacteraceae bacterium]
MVETPEPSDQQPEEGPSEQVAEDKQDPSEGTSEKGGDDASREAGGQATGNPANAG